MARIAWFHARPVYPPRGGAEVRCAGLIALATSLGHEVLLVHPARGETDQVVGVPTVEVEERRGFARLAGKLFSRQPLRAPSIGRRARARARSRLVEFDADVCVVSDILSWSVAHRVVGSASLVYDAHNVEHELWWSHLRSASTTIDRVTYLIDFRRVRRIERRILARTAVTMCVSEVDATGIREIAGHRPLVVVPNSVPEPDVAARPAGNPPIVLFVGSLSYPPNVEAVDELVRQVMPRVVELVPGARLVLAGRRPTAHVRALADASPYVELIEDAPDLVDVYGAARCVVIPMRSGSGTNIKLFEAMAFGVPVVATPKAVEGTGLADGDGVLVRRDDSSLVGATVELLTDPALCGRVGDDARRIFHERLSWERAAREPLGAALDAATSYR